MIHNRPHPEGPHENIITHCISFFDNCCVNINSGDFYKKLVFDRNGTSSILGFSFTFQ